MWDRKKLVMVGRSTPVSLTVGSRIQKSKPSPRSVVYYSPSLTVEVRPMIFFFISQHYVPVNASAPQQIGLV